MYKRVPSKLLAKFKVKVYCKECPPVSCEMVSGIWIPGACILVGNIETVVNLQFSYYYNHTPSSRSYSDVVDAWADCACIYQLILKCHL